MFGEVTVFERRHGLDGIGEGVGAGEHEGGEVLEAGVEGALLWYGKGCLGGVRS